MRVIGMMSGTSLDGIDFACCTFIQSGQPTSPVLYKLQHTHSYPYLPSIISLIHTLEDQSLPYLTFKHNELLYTQYVLQRLNDFIREYKITEVHLLSIHGHTIYHNSTFSVQATDLTYLAAKCHIDTVGNFRQMDVFRGAEGAPLVPYGEEIFSRSSFLNLGGIANISHYNERQKCGHDIQFCNLMTNHLSMLHNQSPYDQGGEIGTKGTPMPQIIAKFAKPDSRRSLSREIFRKEYLPVVEELVKQHRTEDVLCSYYHYLAGRLNSSAEQQQIICTGGGAKNTFLMSLLSNHFVVAEQQMVDFKEAIVFAYLGYKFINNRYNCQTGVGGCLVKGKIRK